MRQATERLDRKDLGILRLLACNCRYSHRSLAGALHCSEDSVAYRIACLERDGWLSRRVLFIDGRTLGFTRCHVLLRFERTPSHASGLYERLAGHPMVMWINSFIGKYDVQVIVDARDSFQLHEIVADLLLRAKEPVLEYSILTHLSDLEFTHLNPAIGGVSDLPRKDDSSLSSHLTSPRFPVNEKFTLFPYKRVDLELLKSLSEDPALSMAALAVRAGCDRATARERLIKMIEANVIINFGAVPSVEKFGFVVYYLLVRIRQGAAPKVLQRPFQRLNNIFYAGRMLGGSDLILYLNARSPGELNQSIELFRQELGNQILGYDLLVQDKLWHWRQFTPGMYAALQSREHHG